MKIASLFALFSLTAGSLTAEITHFTDFAAAQALAKKENKDLSTLSLVALKSSLGLTREEITRVTKVVAKEHRRWKVLDAEYRKAKNDPESAKSYRAAIARLKVRHDKNHATLESLKGLVIKHQEAIMRQDKIHQAEGEAEDLLKSAEELRKKAEEVERAGS